MFFTLFSTRMHSPWRLSVLTNLDTGIVTQCANNHAEKVRFSCERWTELLSIHPVIGNLFIVSHAVYFKCSWNPWNLSFCHVLFPEKSHFLVFRGSFMDTAFVQVLEILESPWISKNNLPGLESPGILMLVLESTGNLNWTKFFLIK